ncbi:phosphatase PAP2 family protein [Cellvibrio japonicus]|nr:phosphatase PAP2 family protein [Cellvibrio japonicus]QEI11575.1 phosphatase PAP2 family protein [Cellvibrio japonicus]QEI15149.1 phosphatase PAP2 family protein [Cellvibrio japonicus]QEI18729.1 phosphatase PAP2 family protein [Cellvibrio japonicus]
MKLTLTLIFPRYWMGVAWGAILLLLATALLEIFQIDSQLADYLYRSQGGGWIFRREWITAVLVHKGGKYLSLALLACLSLLWAFSYRLDVLKNLRIHCRYLVVTALSSCTLVSLLKATTHISCPWDFARYGGDLEYISLAQQLWLGTGDGCFPAGHASAGYAWMGLYFVGLFYRSVWRWLGFGIPLLSGVVFGVSQQLRGAHFLSHDLWSLGVCWIIAFILYQQLLQPYIPTSQQGVARRERG